MANLNETPTGERVQIAILGRTNAGKSALINAMTGQSLAIVSPVSGTTTDPVSKSMELLPLGPVTLIDTPGLDDESELGAMRIEKTRQVLTKCDIAIVVADAASGLTETETALIAELRAKNLPHLVVLNKCDLAKPAPADGVLCVSALTGEGIEELKNRLAAFAPNGPEQRLVGD
ncbi:MAG: GTP-binding protein, partial [Clostridia bacterium]|nr:GTP-binding protein [Clostridia bacterium]